MAITRLIWLARKWRARQRMRNFAAVLFAFHQIHPFSGPGPWARAHLGPYCPGPGPFGPFWAWAHIARAHLGPFGPGPFLAGPIWAHIARALLGLGPFWAHLGPFYLNWAPILFKMGHPCKPLWALRALRALVGALLTRVGPY